MDPKDLELLKQTIQEIFPPIIREIVHKELEPTKTTVIKLSENYASMEKFFQFAFEEAVGRIDKRDLEVGTLIQQQADTTAAINEITKRLESIEGWRKESEPTITNLRDKLSNKKLFIASLYGAAATSIFTLGMFIIVNWPKIVMVIHQMNGVKP